MRRAGELADLPPTVAFPRDVQIAGDRGEKERRKRRVRNCAGIMAGAILWPMPRSRERVAQNARCRSQESVSGCTSICVCVTVVVTNSAIDEREVILFCRKLELLNIENSGARKVGYFCSSENFPSSASAKVRSCKTENFQVGNIFRYFEGRWFYTRERFRTVKYFGFSRARIASSQEFRSRENLRNDKNFASRRQQSCIPQMISFRDPQEILRHTSFSPRHIFNKPT